MATFKEVMMKIKSGETWTDGKYNIGYKSTKDSGLGVERITITTRDSNYIGNTNYIDMVGDFTLERYKYDFEKAFVELKNGKEIESLSSGFVYKIINDQLCYHGDYSKTFKPCSDITYDEMMDKWYVQED